MPPKNVGVEILLTGREIDEQVWHDLLAVRLQAIKPILDRYAWPRAKEALQIPVHAIQEFSQSRGYRRGTMLAGELEQNCRVHGRTLSGISGIFHPYPHPYAGVGGRYTWYGLTSKYRWVRVTGECTFDEASPGGKLMKSITFSHQTISLEEVLETLSHRWVCDTLIGNAMRAMGERYSLLMGAVATFKEQDQVISALSQRVSPPPLYQIP